MKHLTLGILGAFCSSLIILPSTLKAEICHSVAVDSDEAANSTNLDSSGNIIISGNGLLGVEANSKIKSVNGVLASRITTAPSEATAAIIEQLNVTGEIEVTYTTADGVLKLAKFLSTQEQAMAVITKIGAKLALPPSTGQESNPSAGTQSLE